MRGPQPAASHQLRTQRSVIAEAQEGSKPGIAFERRRIESGVAADLRQACAIRNHDRAPDGHGFERWQAEPPPVIAGSALEAFGERLHTAAALCITKPRSRAHALADVAQQLWAEGATTDAVHALPLYLRDKVAQTTVEREAIRLAKEAAT